MDRRSWVILLGISITLICFILVAVYFIRQAKLKKRFREKFHLSEYEVPKKLKYYKIKPSTGSYSLGFPRWGCANRDGTRDKRYANNSLIYQNCYFSIDEFRIIGKDPAAIMLMVNLIRIRNPHKKLPLCKQEIRKRSEMLQRKRLLRDSRSIADIIGVFSDDPYEFERFVANLYRKIGYDVKQTSKSRDGGYDLIMEKNNRKTIVECKCFSKGHHIGRPLIQKLVGANQVAKSDQMIFVTTSDFTDAAIEYAEQTGVRLVNGSVLLRMKNEIYGVEDEIRLNLEDWILTLEDLREYYPPDVSPLW